MSDSMDSSPNHGLIRDVLLNPSAYRDFLLDAYDLREDGVITEEELNELKSFQSALGISDEEAARMNVEAAMKNLPLKMVKFQKMKKR